MDLGLHTTAPSWAAVIAWCYLATNATRLLTYLPQILAVWRCRDGARAISLLTWGSWCVSHLAAVLYGLTVLADMFFVAISVINFLGSVAVTGIAAVRRRQHARCRGWGRPVAAE